MFFNIQSAICTNEKQKLQVKINNIKIITNNAINKLPQKLLMYDTCKSNIYVVNQREQKKRSS